MALASALTACQRGPSQAQATADPFETLDLFRTKGATTPAKDFTVPSLTPNSLRLADFTQQVILLNFWATWCLPCREEMPSMERLYQRYKTRGVTILAISIDTNIDAVRPFLERYRLTFPIGLDPNSALAKEYGMRALPTTYVIDRARNVVAVAVGARDWDSQSAHAVVDALLR